jgi:hypothetical protein
MFPFLSTIPYFVPVPPISIPTASGWKLAEPLFGVDFDVFCFDDGISLMAACG